MKYQYVEDFKNLGFGMFVHFGVYSVLKKGEWAKNILNIPYEEYDKLIKKFNVTKNWAKNLVKTAKNAGCKYITLTTRHHDGFSLYDTKGLSNYDINLTKQKRDLVKEFVDACNEQGIVPFFYHTLLDWHHPDFNTDFPKYIDYLVKSVEILCTNYGKIGGFWYDGMWSKWDENWQEDRLYGTIRKYQPTAMIINNTGLSRQGEQGHPEIDSVTFERGEASVVENVNRPLAGEVCDALNDHWGYAEYDINYKSIKQIIKGLINARKVGANYLLNVGLQGNGELTSLDKGYFEAIGKWIKVNKNVYYNLKKCDITAENALILTDGDNYYAILENSVTGGTNDVMPDAKTFEVKINANIKNVKYLDNGKSIKVKNNAFMVDAYEYGTNYLFRIAKFNLK